MCGICGIVIKRNSRAGADALAAAMTRSLAHRGPDDNGTFSDPANGVFLGHTRLSIIDLSTAGKQPFLNETGKVAAMVNGEIYNYRELKTELLANGHKFVSQTDSEVVLHLFEHEQQNAWNRLRGMYACAVYDSVTAELVLARDPLGIKPLYFYEDADLIAFASEIQAFRAVNPAPAFDPDGIADFLLLGCITPPATHLRNVRALMPGQVAIIKDGAVSCSRCAGPDEWCHAALDAPIPAPDQLGRCLADSVARHLVSDAPIGLFLSGGIDSGTIAGLATQALSSDVRAVNVTVPGHELDESKHARLTASTYGIDLQEVPLTQSDFEGNLDMFLRHLDLPSIDGFNTFVVSKAARLAGLTVALSGLGGDELFAGYSTFSWVPFFARVNALAGLMGRFSRRIAAQTLSTFTRTSGAQRIAEFLKMGVPDRHDRHRMDRRMAHLAFRGMFAGSIAENIVAPDLVPNVRASLDRYMDNNAWAEDRLIPTRLAVAGLEIQNYMGPMLLRDTDAVAMAHSLEVRTPLVDIEVVKAALPFLVHPPQGDGFPKWPLRQSLSRKLPDQIVTKKKQAFTFPWQDWMRGTTLSQIDEMLKTEGAWQNAVRPDAVEWWRDAYVSGSAHWRCFWALYVLMRML